MLVFFFFKQKTAYEMRISDWSSDVCSFDLDPGTAIHTEAFAVFAASPLGDAAVVDGAKAMAWTIADLWLRPGLLEEVTAEHRERLAAPLGRESCRERVCQYA